MKVGFPKLRGVAGRLRRRTRRQVAKHDAAGGERHLDDRDRSVEAAEIFLAATAELIERLRNVQYDAGSPLVPVLSRAVICRQHDYLSAVADLGRQRRGWAVVPLLRPACEELIWLSALKMWQRSARETVLLAMARLNSMDDLRAQDRFAGREVMLELGFKPAHLAAGEATLPVLKARLHTEFAKLGFSLHKHQSLPSVRALAISADLRDLYDFIYHATSTTVHFNPGQLMRGVWGHPGEMRIDLTPVEARLADFGAYWGVRLVLDTLIAGLPLTAWEDQGETLDTGEIERAARMLGGQRPFVLPDELDWPEPS